MPTTRAVARKPRTRVRAVSRITWEVVLLVGRLRAFFTSERDKNAAEMLEQPVDRTAAATGLSRSTVIRIANGEYADTRPLSGKRERRVSKRRVPTSDISRVREIVYAQYAEKTVPTLVAPVRRMGRMRGARMRRTRSECDFVSVGML